MGVELNADYYHISTQYLAEIEMTLHAPTLFDVGAFGANMDDDAADVPEEELMAAD